MKKTIVRDSPYWDETPSGQRPLENYPMFRGPNADERVDTMREWSAREAMQALVWDITQELHALATGDPLEISFTGKLTLSHRVEHLDQCIRVELEIETGTGKPTEKSRRNCTGIISLNPTDDSGTRFIPVVLERGLLR